jgi:protein phosphatase PTC2/3
VVREDSFPWNPEVALAKGFQKAEDKFMNEVCLRVSPNGEQTLVERSGSCAIVVLIVGEMCYVANVGDSRAVMSSNGGTIVQPLSYDHKPCDPEEYQRIIAAGG